ncbi:hypothetical protein [Massilia sp. S19_KUP03_FR1]|uniref:hypothetical protein n=1 Tax=Massilia sp. S19_KUP03_FR1 TaxID=3025503 RepID=UPI002FCDAE62
MPPASTPEFVYLPQDGEMVSLLRATDWSATSLGAPSSWPDIWSTIGPMVDQGGLGIGLALVKHLVELLGGAVSATSEGPRRGSLFATTLPLDSSGRPSSPACSTSACPISTATSWRGACAPCPPSSMHCWWR